MKHFNWTTGQLTKLRQHYPTIPWEFLLAEFASHPKRSIEQTAHDIGLRRNGKKWLAIVAAHKSAFAFGVARP